MRVFGLAALAATCVGVAWASTFWLPSQAEAPFALIEHPTTERPVIVAAEAKADLKTVPAVVAPIEPQLSPATVVMPITSAAKTTTMTTTTATTTSTTNVIAQMQPEPAKPATETTPHYSPAVETAEAKPVEPPKPVVPTLIAKVNLSTQTMTVVANGKTLHSWKVSSGAVGYPTPTGTFKPGWMAKMWHSKQYDDAPMPHSVFFKDGAAIHATTSVGRLGTAASHGCS
jgi:lipoprotein-anchoring transpeptidase ErfK/SrfK